MALAGRKDPKVEGGRVVTAPINPQDNLSGVVQREPVAVPRPERSSLIDSQYIPAQHILNQVDGTPTPIDYYSQVLGQDDIAKPLQLGVSKSAQKYHLIKDFIFRITSGLVPSQDGQSKEWSAEGTGNVTYGIIPKYGDVIVMDTGEGQLGMLTITTDVKTSYTKNGLYEVTFKLQDRNTPDYRPDWYEQLNKKVVATSIFDPELLELLDNPFLSEEDFVAFKGIDESMEELREYFIPRFWVPNVLGYRIPFTDDSIYDGWHAEFCRKIGLFDKQRGVTLYQNGPMSNDTIATLWDCLLSMNLRHFDRTKQLFGIVPVHLMRKWPVLRGVGYSPYDFTIYPIGKMGMVEDTFDKFDPEPFSAHVTPFDYVNAPSYIPIDINVSYVLSRAFYERDTEAMSSFERAVFTMLSGKFVDNKAVTQFYKEYYNLRTLEQYYYGPILYVLLNYVKRNPQWE